MNFIKSFIEKNTRSLRNAFYKVNINFVEFCLTTRCTLKCKKCWHLMPYYLFNSNGIKKAGDFPFKEVKKSIKKFLQTVNIVENFCLLGGEPFIYNDLDKVIKILDNSKKVKRIGIITNGTIIPNKKIINAISIPKVYVEISDYGKLSTHLKDVIKILNENKIPYTIRNCYEDLWVDPGEITSRGLSEEQLCKQYSECTVPLCQLILDGKFYMCPRCAHMINLKLIPNNKEYVDFIKNNRWANRIALKKLFNRKFLTSCNYCNSISSDKRIEAAEQFSQEEVIELKQQNI